ncbi:qcr9 subunit 9 of the ubiquinol cytochrome-c reductase complex [Aspergillus fumigatus]
MLVLTVGRENAQGGHPEALRETGSGRPINDPVIPAAAFRAGSKLQFNLSVWHHLNSQWPVLSLPLSTSMGLIRRNAVYLTTIFAGAFAFELAFDTASNKIWDAMNRGRQWKDIKHRYMNKEEEEED